MVPCAAAPPLHFVRVNDNFSWRIAPKGTPMLAFVKLQCFVVLEDTKYRNLRCFVTPEATKYRRLRRFLAPEVLQVGPESHEVS